MTQAGELEGAISSKERVVALLLCFFLGAFGAHRFYAGRTSSAVLMLILTALGWVTAIIGVGFVLIAAAYVWAFIDFIIILIGSFKDKNGLPIVNWIRQAR